MAGNIERIVSVYEEDENEPVDVGDLRVLAAKFGDEYQAYKARTWF